MTTTLTKHERNLSALIHASMFTKYFIPLGNFILPLILWLTNRNQFAFVDHNGKQALNFQISILLYSILLAMFSVPFFIGALPLLFDGNLGDFPNFDGRAPWNFHFDGDWLAWGSFFWPMGILGLGQLALALWNIVYSILATIRTQEGENFQYPLTIKFIK